MRTPVPDYSNSAPITLFRYWLIKLIAGKTVVLLNANISFAESKKGEAAQVYGCKGFYMNNTTFPVDGSKLLRIEQND